MKISSSCLGFLAILAAASLPVQKTKAAASVGAASPSSAVATPSSAFVCDYLGETPPGDEPVVFGQGVVSVEGRNTHALHFSPDGRMLIFSRYPDGTSFRMMRGKDGWSPPAKTSFTGKEVTFDAASKRLFYYDRNGDLSWVRYGDSGFSASTRLGGKINTRETEYYTCPTTRGKLYFSRNAKWDQARIMVAKPAGEDFTEPVDLGDVVNSGGASHGFVAPDESYVLFNSPRAGSTTKNDIWVSFRGADGTLQAPVNLGPRINRDAMAVLCPTVSPDGKYLFFTRLQEGGTGCVYWVSTASFLALRPPSDGSVASWLKVTQLAEKTWRISDHGIVNSYLLEGNQRALLIDNGYGVANIRDVAQSLTKLPLAVVVTHGHRDHCGAVYQFPLVYAHPLEFDSIVYNNTSKRRAINARIILQDTQLPETDLFRDTANLKPAKLVPINEGLIFNLGGRKLEVIEVPGHTPGSIALLDASNKMLFAGDDNNALVWLFLEGCTPLEIYLKSLEKLKLRVHEFTVIYPGHNEPLDAGFLDEEITCCQSILDGTGKTERYSSSAGDAMLGVFKRARIAFDPDNLLVKR